MVVFPLSLLYILCALGVGYLGRFTRIGWIGVTLFSLVLTPLLMMLAVLLLRTVDRQPRPVAVRSTDS